MSASYETPGARAIRIDPALARASELFTQARALAERNVRDLVINLEAIERLADEVAGGGQLYPAEVREICRTLSAQMSDKRKTMSALRPLLNGQTAPLIASLDLQAPHADLTDLVRDARPIPSPRSEDTQVQDHLELHIRETSVALPPDQARPDSDRLGLFIWLAGALAFLFCAVLLSGR